MTDDDTLCLLSRAAKKHPQAEALCSAEQSLSFSELDCRVDAASLKLIEAGIAPGDRVALIGPNSIDAVVLILAVIRAGCVMMPISDRFPTRTVETVLRSVDASLLISNDPAHTDSTTSTTVLLSSLLANIKESSEHKSHPVGHKAHSVGLKQDATKEVTVLPSSEKTGSKKSLRNKTHSVGLKQDATIVLTSGTTAQPKAALHTYGNHYYSALGSNEIIPLGPGDRWLLSLPLYHVGGLAIIWRCLLSGATMVVPKQKQNLAVAIDEYRVTHLSLVPTQLESLLNSSHSPNAIDRLLAVLVGGGVVQRSLIERALAAGLPVFTTYGLTEMASQVATAESTQKDLSSVRVLKHREMKIGNADEILVKGDCLFKGYIHDGQVDPAVDDNGWFHTGDIGEFDENNCLHLIGRIDNMFVSGGENIHPEEIEGALCRLPEITQALVVGVTDKTYGCRPVAFVKMRSGYLSNKQKIITELSRHLPRFKIPIAFYNWPDDILADQTKPNRRQLTALAEEKLRQSD